MVSCPGKNTRRDWCLQGLEWRAGGTVWSEARSQWVWQRSMQMCHNQLEQPNCGHVGFTRGCMCSCGMLSLQLVAITPQCLLFTGCLRFYLLCVPENRRSSDLLAISLPHRYHTPSASEEEMPCTRTVRRAMVPSAPVSKGFHRDICIVSQW